jgi:hypothetical protein
MKKLLVLIFAVCVLASAGCGAGDPVKADADAVDQKVED